MNQTVLSRSYSSSYASVVILAVRLARRATRSYCTAARQEETMLAPPSATAVAVGIAISSTSRDRTRQFLRTRRRGLLAIGLRPEGAVRCASAGGSVVAAWSRIAGSGTSVAGRPAGRAKAA